MENATKTRTRKVLTEKDFPGTKSDKQLAAEERRELAKIGKETGAKPYAQIKAEQEAAKGGAKLAGGLTGRNAPHSSKSVSDNARTAKAAAKAEAPAKTAPAKGKGKAAAPAKAAKPTTSRSADNGAKLTVLVKAKDSGLRPESGRYAKLAAAEKAKTVGDWLGKTVTDATGAQHKCDRGALGGMIKRGHVKIG